jgi:ferredoxin
MQEWNNGRMRIVINRDTCESNGLCAGLAPMLFELNDNDELVVLNDSPTGELEERARKAMKLCPKQAISLID